MLESLLLWCGFGFSLIKIMNKWLFKKTLSNYLEKSNAHEDVSNSNQLVRLIAREKLLLPPSSSKMLSGFMSLAGVEAEKNTRRGSH